MLLFLCVDWIMQELGRHQGHLHFLNSVIIFNQIAIGYITSVYQFDIRHKFQ